MDPEEQSNITQTQSFEQRFLNSMSNVQEQNQVMIDLLVSAGFDKTVAEGFIKINSKAFAMELNDLGANEKNPFILFLLEYRKNNGNLVEFSQSKEKYNIVHNARAYHWVDDKQLTFTCPEYDQPRILLNKNLYTINSSKLAESIVKVWVDLGDERIKKFIINKYVKYLITKDTFTYNENHTKNDGLIKQFNDFINEIDFTDNTIYNDLRKSIIYSTALQKAIDDINKLDKKNESKWVSNLNNIKDTFKTNIDDNHISMISGKIIDTTLMQKQINLLNKDVQQSDISSTGQYQETGDASTTKNRTQQTRRSTVSNNNYNNSSTKNINDPKTQDEISTLKRMYNVKDNKDLINNLEDTVKLLRTANVNTQEELDKYNQVYSALQNLGYRKNTIDNVLSGVDFSKDDANTILRNALGRLR